MKNIYLTLIGFFFTLFISAQVPYYYTLSEEDGLPTSEIYQVKQDKFGFIWIGCDAGLFRYDGVRYKQYSYGKENGRSISELRFDSKGQLWCQNFTGQIFTLRNDSLTLFKDFSKELRVYPQFCNDNDGNVWIATEKYLEKFNSNAVSLFKLFIEKDSVSWFDIEVDERNRIFASSFQLGFCEIQEINNSYKTIPINKQTEFTRLVIEKVKSGLYAIEEVSTGKHYTIYKLLNGKLTAFSQCQLNGFVYKVYEDNEGDIWLCTSDGVYGVDKISGQVNKKNPILEGDKISSFFQDSEQNIWLSSLQNGIHIIPNKLMFVLNDFHKASLDKYVSSLTLSNHNELLAGTYSGSVYKITENNTTTEAFKRKDEYKAVKKILPYKNGFFISRSTFNYINSTKEIEIPALKNVRDFCVLKDTIYFITSHMIGFFPLFYNSDCSINPNHRNFPIMQKAGRSVACDTLNSKVFFASNDGVYEYFENRVTPLNYKGERISAGKLIFENDVLWIATINKGFITYKNKLSTEAKINFLIRGKNIKTFKVNNNLLWVATEKCLNKIDLKNETAEYYDQSDGLMSREINEIVFANHKVYLATNKGIVYFPENAASRNIIPPPIAITDVNINDTLVELHSVSKMDYRNSKINFNFISASFRARGKFNYKYRLIGLDTNWTFIPAFNNSVMFASLPAGNFRFEVKAVNEDGVESIRPDTFSFNIKKPFWQKIWFYLLIAASGAFLVFLISALVIKNIRKKARIKNELTASQLTAIRAQMNPHFMYNTLNSIQDLILKSDIKNTNYYLSKFSSLMRKILKFSDNEKVVLEEEIEMLNDYLELEKLRFGNEFKYEITVSSEIKTAELLLPSLIIQPFVENAIKHGLLHKKGEKKLGLTFSVIKNKLIVIIEDNGVGRKRSAEIKTRSKLQHKSFAASAVQKRVELLNSNGINTINYQIVDLYDNNNEPSGIKVEIVVFF